MHDENTCDECGQREVVIYKCTACPCLIIVDGEFSYYAQGRGHWHTPDDQERFMRLVSEHVTSHIPQSCMMPTKVTTDTRPVVELDSAKEHRHS